MSLAASVCGLLALIALIAMSGVVATGKTRRRRWLEQVEAMDRSLDCELSEHAQRARAAQRGSDFLSDALRRIYYLMALGSAALLLVLPWMEPDPKARAYLWAALSASTFAGSLILLLDWYGWDDDRETWLRNRIQLARERTLIRRGMLVRDRLTGLFTSQYWRYAVGRQMGRILPRQTPITCLAIEVAGISQLRALYGNQTADQALIFVGQQLSHNVRAADTVCRLGGARFAIALYRCPGSHARSVAERVTANVRRLVLDGLIKQYRCHLALEWGCAALPDDANTPTELLRTSIRNLNQLQPASSKKPFSHSAPLAERS